MYGIIGDADIRCGPIHGHGGAEVFAFRHNNVAGVVSDARCLPLEPSVENVWRHERVLGALTERHAVLPMRFGTACEAGELFALLEMRRSAIYDGLGRVAGRVEVAVRISDKAPASPPKPDRCSGEGAGTAYLMARLEDRGQSAAVERIRIRLSRLSEESIWDDGAGTTRGIKGSCLIGRKSVAEFAEAVGGLARANPDVAVSCTGPWTPYSFVGGLAAGD
ncbi:MAG: GvpL/GvpF family gas vesicle protein [Sphingomonadales bacterium]|nr:GvpL/GvpF family gas vesicle protein [Sphingomonadales bacterium]